MCVCVCVCLTFPPFSSHTFLFISFSLRVLDFHDFSLSCFEFPLFHCLFAAHVICNNFPNMQHSSASATSVRTSNIFSVLPFVRACTICLHMQHLTALAQFYHRLRPDFLLPPPQAFLQCFSVSWTPASSSRYSDGLALQLAPDIFLFSSSLLLPPFSV